MGLLHRSRLDVPPLGELPLLCRGLSLHPSVAAIVAHVSRVVINCRPICICMAKVGRVYVAHSRVIRKVPPLPATAVIAIAAITIAVIDTAIKTNVLSPVT